MVHVHLELQFSYPLAKGTGTYINTHKEHARNPPSRTWAGALGSATSQSDAQSTFRAFFPKPNPRKPCK